MTLLERGAVEFGLFVASQEEAGGFGEGPLEMGVADLGARGAVAFAAGFSGALDEAAVA